MDSSIHNQYIGTTYLSSHFPMNTNTLLGQWDTLHNKINYNNIRSLEKKDPLICQVLSSLGMSFDLFSSSFFCFAACAMSSSSSMSLSIISPLPKGWKKTNFMIITCSKSRLSLDFCPLSLVTPNDHTSLKSFSRDLMHRNVPLCQQVFRLRTSRPPWGSVIPINIY